MDGLILKINNSCKDCIFKSRRNDDGSPNNSFRILFDHYCTQKDVIAEHLVCCRNLSTGFTGINLIHARIVHCNGEYYEERK